MTSLKQILIFFAITLLFAIIGLLFGAWFGGNYGFPEMFGTRGYEAGGILFGMFGIGIGLSISYWFTRK